MIKSVLNPYEKLQEKLLQVSSLVNAFQKKDRNATENWTKWLKETEDIMNEYQFTESSELAGVRASLLLYLNDINNERVSKKKKLVYYAIQSIEKSQVIVVNKHRVLEEKIENANQLIRQILIPAKEAGLIKYDSNVDFNVFLESLLTQLKSNKQIAPTINSIIAMVGKFDLLRIMAENIDFN